MSIYVTQLIYVKKGQEDVFLQFEEIAMPLIPKYKGQLLLRARPAEHEIIEGTIDPPYEIHLVTFESDDDFQGFMLDKEREKFLHLKEQSIKSVLLIKGNRL